MKMRNSNVSARLKGIRLHRHIKRREWMEAFRFAMQMEEDGTQFYSSASRRTKNEDGKKIYLYLAEEEKKHLKKLEKEYLRLQNRFSWIDKNELPEKGKLEKSVVEFLPKDIRRLIGRKDDRQDAIWFGIHTEEMGYRLYEELAKMTFREKGLSRLFKRFSMDEREHLRILQSQLEEMKK